MTDSEAIEIHIAENIHRIEVMEDFMNTNSDDAVCRKNILVLSKINGLLQMVQQYRAIGTVEECRAAVENHSEKKVFVVVQGNYALSKNMDAFSTRELADGFRKHIRKESNFNGCINVFELEVDGAVLKEEDM